MNNLRFSIFLSLLLLTLYSSSSPHFFKLKPLSNDCNNFNLDRNQTPVRLHSILESHVLEDRAPLKTPWEFSPVLPQWMKHYFRWHSNQLRSLNESNWQSYKYLVRRCLLIDETCGGASDRLHKAPLLVRWAYEQKRILFFKWERPAALEEFLVPPIDGLDWRLPDWLFEKFTFNPRPSGIINSSKIMIDNMGHGGVTQGQDEYDRMKSPEEPSYDEIYHDAWNALFQPSPPVAKLIQVNLNKLVITPNNYTSLHIRSKYTQNIENNDLFVENAVNCASNLHPGYTIVVASDSTLAARKAIEYGKKHLKEPILSRLAENQTKEPLHIQRGSEYLTKIAAVPRDSPSDYYDTFVDLYLMQFGECTAFGKGAYGLWANRMSSNWNCSIRYTDKNCTYESYHDNEP